MQTNFPSIKTIMTCGVERDTAKQIKAALTMTRQELLELDAGRARARGCYNPPATQDIRLAVLDSLLGTYGVEYCGTDKGEPLEYCNTGDSYTPTICYFRGRFIVSSWGDIIERSM